MNAGLWWLLIMLVGGIAIMVWALLMILKDEDDE